MDMRHVEAAFEAAAAHRPLALVIRRGSAVVLSRAAGRRADGRPFEVDTPVLLYSVVKAAVAVTALVLAARGDVDLDAPVARRWPAFGAHGKGPVTGWQALSHAAAVPGWPVGMSVDGLRDVDAACDALVDQPPWWPVGEPGEHVYSYGHVVSGLLRGAVGRHVHQVWEEEVAPAIGVDLTFRSPTDAEPVSDPGGAFLRSMTARASTGDPRLWQPLELCDAAVVNAFSRPDPPIAPAVLGWGGADAIARLYGFWSGGDGHLPGKPAVWARSRTALTTGVDHVMGDLRSWGAGVVVEDGLWGMGGIGGCAGWHDERSGLSIGITTPVLGSGPALEGVETALDALRDG